LLGCLLLPGFYCILLQGQPHSPHNGVVRQGEDPWMRKDDKEAVISWVLFILIIIGKTLNKKK